MHDMPISQIITPGSKLRVKGQEFVIENQIGRGVFGVVYAAKQAQSRVAIKLMKTGVVQKGQREVTSSEFEERLKAQSQQEIQILRFLNSIDHERGFIVRLMESFKVTKRAGKGSGLKAELTALVFEPLEINLLDLMHSETVQCDDGTLRPKGLSLKFIKVIAWQVLAALSLLSMPNVNVIHCDLKPENIMLKYSANRSELPTCIKLIDFGSACYAAKKMFKYVQSRHYRAPEVLLELPYSTQIDVWSLGCLLFELHFGGEKLYPCDGTDGMLDSIARHKNEPVPKVMLDTSPLGKSVTVQPIIEGVSFKDMLRKRICAVERFNKLYEQ